MMLNRPLTPYRSSCCWLYPEIYVCAYTSVYLFGNEEPLGRITAKDWIRQGDFLFFFLQTTHHSADGNTAASIHVGKGGVKVVTADVLEVNIDALGCQARQSVEGALLLIVETSIEAELLNDKVELGVGADGADDAQALVLGELADNLADGASGRADKDGLTGLGAADLLQARVRRQARHAQRAQEHTQVKIRRVLDLFDASGRGVRDHTVLGDGQERLDEVALLEVRVGGLQDPRERPVQHGPVQLEGWRVRLHGRVPHPAPQVRVVGGVEDLEDQAALRRVLVDVEGPVLDSEVLPGLGHSRGHGLGSICLSTWKTPAIAERKGEKERKHRNGASFLVGKARQVKCYRGFGFHAYLED